MMGIGSDLGEGSCSPGEGGGESLEEVTEELKEPVALKKCVPAGLWTVRVTGIWMEVNPLVDPPGWQHSLNSAPLRQKKS